MLPHWLSRFVPSLDALLTVAPIALLVGLAAAALAAHLRTRGVRTAYTRKVFHFTIFTAASVIQLTSGLGGVVVFGSIVALIVLFAVWRGAGHVFYEALARPGDAPRGTLFIVVPLVTTALGGVLSNLIVPAWAWVGYLVAGWGDAVGEPVGARWGRHRYRVPSLAGVPATRSWEGSAAVLVVGAAAAVIGGLLAGFEAGVALRIGMAAGIAGALVEAVSNHGLDNLTVQVAASMAAALVA
jgi:phytol kinase